MRWHGTVKHWADAYVHWKTYVLYPCDLFTVSITTTHASSLAPHLSDYLLLYMSDNQRIPAQTFWFEKATRCHLYINTYSFPKGNVSLAVDIICTLVTRWKQQLWRQCFSERLRDIQPDAPGENAEMLWKKTLGSVIFVQAIEEKCRRFLSTTKSLKSLNCSCT